MGRDVHAPPAVTLHRRAVQHAEDCKLCANRLARAARRAHDGIVPGVVQAREGLGLDGVEVRKVRVQCRVLVVAERRHRERLEVQELGGWGVLLREDEVAEGDGQLGLGPDPAVRHHPHEVLRGEGLLDRHREADVAVLLRELPFKYKVLMVQDGLAIPVLHKDPERLHPAVDLLLPFEVRSDGEVDLEDRTGDGLHLRRQLEARELVHKLVDRLAHLGEADQLSDLLAAEVVVALPGEVLLLHFVEDLHGDARELAEGRLRGPHAPVDHAAEGESLLRQGSPPALEDDLEQRAHDATGGLGHVDHVGHEGETLQLEPRDVRLQEHVDLGTGLVQ
mmetsp:Transcript_58155/g.185069  ORF Transcript_58155/g.185069 Transcript_58155/m.185069 type:complete len:335 (-) Transcript_58155:3332-4336(-)